MDELQVQIQRLADAISALSTGQRRGSIVQAGARQQLIGRTINVIPGTTFVAADPKPNRWGINIAVQFGSDNVDVILPQVTDDKLGGRLRLAFLSPGEERYWEFAKHGAIVQQQFTAVTLSMATIINVIEVVLLDA